MLSNYLIVAVSLFKSSQPAVGAISGTPLELVVVTLEIRRNLVSFFFCEQTLLNKNSDRVSFALNADIAVVRQPDVV